MPSYEGAVPCCSLEYLEDGLSKGLVVSTFFKRGPHPFGSRHLVGLLVPGPSRSGIDEAPEIRTSSDEPIAQLVESRPVDAMIAQIEPKDRGRALIGADPLGRWNLRELLELVPGKSLTDVRPCLVQTERLVHVAHENFCLSAPFLLGGLDIVFEDILPDSIGIFGCSRRVAGEEPAILPQPAAPVRQPVVGAFGVRHQNPVVLSPIAGIFPHPAQPFTQRLETVRFPGFLQIPERHSKLFQFPFDRPDTENTGVPPGDGLSPALLEPGLESAFLCHGLIVICILFSMVVHSFPGLKNDIQRRSGATAKSFRRRHDAATSRIVTRARTEAPGAAG